LYSYFKPKKVYGVDLACYHIQACRETFIEEKQKSLIMQRKKLRRTIAKKSSICEPKATSVHESNRARTQSMNISASMKNANEFFFSENSPNEKSKFIKTSNQKDHNKFACVVPEAGEEYNESVLSKGDEKSEVESAQSLLQKIDEM